MKFNWKFFCIFGILWSVLIGGMSLISGLQTHNYSGAKVQLVFFLAYAAGLVYISLKEKKSD